MIDLHIHTTCSDGTDNPMEVLRKAQELGLKYISITDHNTCNAYKELEKININDIYKGKLIKGCEIKTIYKNTPIEILAYNIDYKKLNQYEWMQEKYLIEVQNKFLDRLKKVSELLGLEFDKDIKIENSRQFSAQVIHSELKRYPENEKFFTSEIWDKLDRFYREHCCNKDSYFYIDETKDIPHIKEVIKAIHDCGGVGFIAHLYLYPINNPIDFVYSMMKDKLIDGIECYHSYFTKQQTNQLLEICKRENLLISGGSDYHGENKKNVLLGTGRDNLNISVENIKNWI